VSVEDVFRTLQRALDTVGIPYMVTGSFASSAHGEPRASKDIDIVIAPTREQLIELIKQFPAGEYHAVEYEALWAFDHRSMFNLVDYATGWRVDLILKKPRPFSDTEFNRREVLEFAGLRLSFASAEDILISKLEWVKEGESQRQLEDAAGIIRVQGENLDTAYVEYWVHQLGLDAQWILAQARAVG
jgi:hypothetical protein